MFKLLIVMMCLLPCVVNAAKLEIIDGGLVELCKFVSHATQENIVIDGDLDFPITAICPDLPPTEYLNFLESVVVANGGSFAYKNSIYIVSLLKETEAPKVVDKPLFSYVYQTQNTSPDSIVESLELFEVKVDIISNHIVLVGIEDDVLKCLSVLKALDVPPSQYIVEAVIFEVRESDYYNIDYSIDLSGTDVFTRLTDTFGGLSPLSFPAGLSSGISTPDFNLVIQAIESSSDGSMLSTPRLVVSDRRQGLLSVGQNIPFLTGSYEDSEGDTPFQTIERKDVGISLTVVPTKISDDLLSLVISQVVSSVNTSVVALDIVTNSRQLRTDVVIKTGDYIYLGGLQDKTEEEIISGIPFLSSIPLIGDLFFTFRKTETTTSNLNILFRVTKV